VDFKVSGSDISDNDQIRHLRNLGIKIHIGHDAKNLPNDCTHVIVNGAIADDNPEYMLAKKRGIKIIDRAELLAEISRGYKNIIAVAGTSGKSSTTAMIGAIFTEAMLSPTIHNGAVSAYNANLGLVHGGDEFFISEACEFKKSFLKLEPTVGVITNINPDHMDCYKDFDDLMGAFGEFADKTSRSVFVNADCKNYASLDFSASVEMTNRTFGIKNKADITATNIIEFEKGKYKFTCKTNSTNFDVTLNVYGYHNIYNALSAIGVALEYNISLEVIQNALAKYKGISRRFEQLSTYYSGLSAVKIISDYAHHPVEIATTIKTAKSLFDKFLIVFQPHTYSRTKALFSEFEQVFDGVDVVFYKTYSAREKVIGGGSSLDLAKVLGKKHYVNKTAMMKHIKKASHKYDAVIFVGAGDIDSISRQIV